jgi:hypothetical protein
MSTLKAKSHPFSPAEHLGKARNNENLARALFDLGVPCCDWIITICFYSTLHYIYSKLPIKSVLNSHLDLNKEIVKYSPKTKLYNIYKSLKDKSEDMRYYPSSANFCKNDRLFCEARFNDLKKIKNILNII